MGAMGAPTAVTLVAATLGWLLVGVLPGWLVASAALPGRSPLDRLALAPAISVGLAYPTAAWVNRVGLDGALPAAATALVLASAAAMAVLVRRRRAGGPSTLADRESLRGLGPPLALVIGLWVVAIATSAAGWGAVPPGSDGSAHGLVTTSLIRTGEVLGRDGYPLGAHLIAALAGVTTSVPSALLVPLTLLGAAWTVLGVAALAGRVARSGARWAAFAAACVPFFPYAQVSWGPVPLVLAVALVPGVALAVVDARGRREVLLAAVAVAGLLAVHVTEVLVAAVLVLLVLVCQGLHVRPLLRGAVVGLGALLLTAPLVAELVGGGAARPQDPPRGDSFDVALVSSSLQPFVPFSGTAALPWVVALVVAGVLLGVSLLGAVRTWGSPYGRSVSLLVLLLLGLALLARMTSGGPLTGPWYGNGDRLVAQVAALVPVLLGFGGQRVLGRVRTGGAAASALAITVGLCALLALGQSFAAAQQGLGRFSVVTDDDRRAFAWLAEHVGPDEQVLNDPTDGSVWMVEATGGASQPVFGAVPGGGFDAQPEWADRLYLRQHAAEIGTDPRVRATAREWGVRYVLYGDRGPAGSPRLIDADALAAAPGVVEVFRSGRVRVFELPPHDAA
jgi:hypothetical protein